jgi:TATA-binding protein-associated factor
MMEIFYIQLLIDLYDVCLIQESENPDCKPLPSIVVCPPTLIGHWVYEVNKFIDKEYLNPLMYAGPPVERLK